MEFLGLDNSILIIAKIAVTILLGLYVFFAVVVVRQVNIMTSTLEVGLERFLETVAVLHLLLAVATLITALVIL